MKIKLRKLYIDSETPIRGSDSAAGYDLFARLIGDCFIGAHTTAKIGTGIAVEIPDGYFGAVFARSGLATKEGLRPANCVGVIDSDYRGEIFVAIHNDTDKDKIVRNGERIAQLVVMPYLPLEFEVVESLSDTARGSGGFGSTGATATITRRRLFRPFNNKQILANAT